MPRIVPGLPELRAASPRVVEQTVSAVQLVQELGALAGRLLFSALVISTLTRRRLLRLVRIAATASRQRAQGRLWG